LFFSFVGVEVVDVVEEGALSLLTTATFVRAVSLAAGVSVQGAQFSSTRGARARKWLFAVARGASIWYIDCSDRSSISKTKIVLSSRTRETRRKIEIISEYLTNDRNILSPVQGCFVRSLKTIRRRIAVFATTEKKKKWQDVLVDAVDDDDGDDDDDDDDDDDVECWAITTRPTTTNKTSQKKWLSVGRTNLEKLNAVAVILSVKSLRWAVAQESPNRCLDSLELGN
jgi:hypothetical protein